MAKDRSSSLPNSAEPNSSENVIQVPDASPKSKKKIKKKAQSTQGACPPSISNDSPASGNVASDCPPTKKRKRKRNATLETPSGVQGDEPKPDANGTGSYVTPESTTMKKRKRRKSSSATPGEEKHILRSENDVKTTGTEPIANGTENAASVDQGEPISSTVSAPIVKENTQNGEPSKDVLSKKSRKNRVHLQKKAKQLSTETDAFPPIAERHLHLHGLLALPLASASVVRAMDDATRHQYLREVSSHCYKILGLLHRLMTAGQGNSADSMSSLEDQLTADMVRLRRLPLARQYVEITLWQRVKEFIQTNLSEAHKLAYGAGESSAGNERVGILLHQPGDVDVNFNSFRDKYLKGVVETYQENLEKIQDNEGLDKEQIGFLVKCLEAGADLFGNVACWDRKRDEPNATGSTQAHS